MRYFNVGFKKSKKNKEVNELLMVKAKATCKEGRSLKLTAIFCNNPKNGKTKNTPKTLNKEAA